MHLRYSSSDIWGFRVSSFIPRGKPGKNWLYLVTIKTFQLFIINHGLDISVQSMILCLPDVFVASIVSNVLQMVYLAKIHLFYLITFDPKCTRIPLLDISSWTELYVTWVLPYTYDFHARTWPLTESWQSIKVIEKVIWPLDQIKDILGHLLKHVRA